MRVHVKNMVCTIKLSVTIRKKKFGYSVSVAYSDRFTLAVKRNQCVLLPSFQASSEELSTFVKLFDHIEDVPAKGFDLEGVHYIVPRCEEKLIFGKRQKSGVFAVKTNMGQYSVIKYGQIFLFLCILHLLLVIDQYRNQSFEVKYLYELN